MSPNRTMTTTGIYKYISIMGWCNSRDFVSQAPPLFRVLHICIQVVYVHFPSPTDLVMHLHQHFLYLSFCPHTYPHHHSSLGDNFAITHNHKSTSENFYFQTQPVNVTSHNKTSVPVIDLASRPVVYQAIFPTHVAKRRV